MGRRSPSRSSDGAASDHHARAEPRLLKAIDHARNNDAVDVIQDAKANARPFEHLLRIGLSRAVERENAPLVEYLLENGAQPDAGPGGRISPLFKAAEKKNLNILNALVRYGCNLDAPDKQGRTALMMAAWKNHYYFLLELLRHGADVGKKDSKGRNVLHNLAADKHCNWGRDVVDTLLRTPIAIDGPDGQDESKRSPLHWAASTGKKQLCEMLLTRPKGLRANINAVEVREKTALHLAVAHGRDDIVELLIHYGADVKAKSDGSWTPLHNACDQGSEKIVRALLAAGAELNAKLLNGKTPLHVAAEAGHLRVVQALLERKDVKRAARDSFGTTPFLRAAQNKRKEIVNILAPWNHVETLSEDALGACNGFNATIVDFGNFHNENKVERKTVFELLYGRDATNPRKPAVTVLPKESKAASFRWIHLPANNVAWVEALLTKAFIEEGASDVEGFKALERSFNHQHRGQQIHSHFMRPLCQSTPRAPKHQDDSDLSDSAADQGPPQIFVNMGSGLGISASASAEGTATPPAPKGPARTGTVSTDATDWTGGSASGTLPGKEKEKGQSGKGSKEKHKKQSKWGGAKQAGGRAGGKSGRGTDTPTRHTPRKPSTPLTGSGHLRSPGSPGRKDPTQIAKGNIFTFMPYLHFETDRRRREMQDAIARSQRLKEREQKDGRIARPPRQRAATYDEMLLRAHLTSSTVSLHVRRTLDQFFYHNIDTRSRDQDQVVYRYQRKAHPGSSSLAAQDPKLVMVDQLWMWILGKDLIVTAFPQRWQQPKNDPLNVLDGIIEDINSKTREPVRSVYDLSMIITGRCTGVFDRQRMGDEEYQFLDMFESSIGDATEMETILFKEFNTASAQASAWLQHHRRPNRFSRHLEAEVRVIEHQSRRGMHSHNHAHALADPPTSEDDFLYPDDSTSPTRQQPLFVDKLLDIGAETDLLAETKDIRDELNMMIKVLEDQRSVIPDLESSLTDIYREAHKSQSELKRRFREHLKTIDTHIKDLLRMDTQAHRIYSSITDLLDLKQKHANAFEARFARDQAAGTARQSQTIMVFTIVTIVFLPLSFIAAVFTINIEEFPRREGGEEPILPWNWVAKYLFGIGFAVSIPLVAVALSVDAIGDIWRQGIRARLLQWKNRDNNKNNTNNNKIMNPGAKNSAPDFPPTYPPFDHSLSTARSAVAAAETIGGGAAARPSFDSYLSGAGPSLAPVTSRSTAGQKAAANGAALVGRRSRETERHAVVVPSVLQQLQLRQEAAEPVPVPGVVERQQSTGFRVWGGDVERG